MLISSQMLFNANPKVRAISPGITNRGAYCFHIHNAYNDFPFHSEDNPVLDVNL